MVPRPRLNKRLNEGLRRRISFEDAEISGSEDTGA
jgi:hypothetical protein